MNVWQSFCVIGGLGASKGGFKCFDWQPAQSRGYFVPLYENKKI